MAGIEYFNKELKKINTNKKIKIRTMKKAKQTRYSLYLDVVIHNRREREYLGHFLLCEKYSLRQDKQTLKYAQEYRDQKERDMLEKKFDFKLVSYDNEVNIFDFIEAFGANKARLPMYLGLKKHLKKFYGEHLRFSDIDKKFCEDFRDYIAKRMQMNSVKNLFAGFKAVLNKALKDEIISKSPCKDIIIKAPQAKREFLTDEEIKRIVENKTIYYDVKNAFLFSCFTGLRQGDIRALTYNEVRDGYLYFRQRKTGDIDRMLLTPDAMKIVEFQKKLHPKYKFVFQLPVSKDKVSRKLKKIIDSSGITKKITMHNGRHTFATRCITKGVDIYTVQKLLGHREIQATMIYAKLIDTKRDEYVSRIPELM